MVLAVFLNFAPHVNPFYAGILFGLWLLFMRLSTMDTTDLERLLAHAVVDALNAARIHRKEAAFLMRISESQLSRQLSAEPGQHVSLTRLMRLTGTGFWWYFGPVLMLLVARERYAEFAETLLFIGKRWTQPATAAPHHVIPEQFKRRA